MGILRFMLMGILYIVAMIVAIMIGLVIRIVMIKFISYLYNKSNKNNPSH